MPQDLHIKPAGLFTDPSPYSSVPEGALREASNLVIRRDGVAEPRPGFAAVALGSMPSGVDPAYPRALIPYDGKLLAIGQVGSGTPMLYRAVYLSDTSTPVDEGNFGTWPLLEADENRVFAAEARKNLYITGPHGLLRLSAGTDTSPEWAGLPAPPFVQVQSTAAGTVLANGDGVGYFATLESERGANNITVTSFPSGKCIYVNNSGVTKDVTVRVYLSVAVFGSAKAGDVVRLYRTPAVASSTPGEAAYEVTAVTLTSAHVTAGYLDIVDTVLEADLGKELYTSAAQGGIVEGNAAPPHAKDVALFKGSLFVANTVSPYAYVLQWDTTDYSSGYGAATVGATSTGGRTVNGVRTNGSPTISSVSSFVGIRVGQLLKFALGSAWAGTGVVRITAINSGAATITVNVNWTGATDGAPVELLFSDSIRISGTDYHPVENPTELAKSINTSLSQYRTSAPLTYFAMVLGPSDKRYDDPSVFSSAIANAQVAILEARPNTIDYLGLTALNIVGTNEAAYKPALPALTDTAAPFERDVLPSAIRWSKSDEPEHWPLGWQALVGGPGQILRIIPTRDALWILKTDGIYRLTGSTAPNWRVDPIDLTTHCLAPKAVAVMDDRIYAWTNHGIVSLGDGGMQRLSSLAIGTDLRQMEIQLGVGNTTTPGVWAVANPKDNEVLFGVTGTDTDEVCETVYCYNVKTQAWTQWLFDDLAVAAYDPSNSSLVLGRGAAFTFVQERLDFLRSDTADESHDVTLGTQTEYDLDLTCVGYAPVAGDLLVKDVSGTLTYTQITAVVSNGGDSYTVTIQDLNFETDANFYILEGYESCLEPVARTGNNPSAHKHFREGSWVFGTMQSVSEVELSITSDLSDTPTTETRSLTPSAQVNPRPLRFLIPRAHARASQVWPKLCIRQAGSTWTVEQLSLFYNDTSSRTRKK